MDNIPPKTHNLLKLLKDANVVLTEEQQLFLLKLNQYQIEGRYPEDIDRLYKITNKELATLYIKEIKKNKKMFSRENAISYSQAFLKACKDLPVKINKAVVFGSSVNSKAKENSDIDIALVSDSFGDNILKNLDLIGKVAIKFPELDIHTFSSKSFKAKKSMMIEEIKRTGITLI